MLTRHQNNALDLSHHISLTANAGSGKTLVLTNRFINIALRPDINLKEIVAITFTDQAAAELQEKISRRIDEEFENATDRQQKIRLKSLRQQISSANISTIHSFCISLLRRYPVEAGLDAGFIAIDNNQSNELLTLAVDATVKEAFDNPDIVEGLKEAVRILGSVFALKQQLMNLIRNRKNFLNLYEQVYSRGHSEIYNFYLEIRKTNSVLWAKIIEKDFLPLINTINDYAVIHPTKNRADREISEKIQNLNINDPAGYISGFVEIVRLMLTDKGELRKNYIKEPVFISEVQKIHGIRLEIAGAIPANDDELLRKLADFSLILCNLFALCFDQYERRKKNNGYLDFEDILLYTQKILKIPSVLEDLADRYKYIMVDEYQDTNDIQYQIFLPILNELQNGNLFVVGDDKQSIYMFRDAELSVFEKTKEKINEKLGKILSLPESFRMAPQLALFNNLVFRRILQNPDKNFNEVEHQDIICAKQTELNGGVEFIIPESEPEENKKLNSEKINTLAGLTAKWILNFLSREETKGIFSYRNIAILCRKRNKFPALEKHLSKNSIPYTIVGGTGYFQRQLILDFYNLFAFLIAKENDHALAALLRSPFFLIPDTSLFNLTKNTGRNLWEKLCNAQNPERGLLAAREKLTRYLSLSATSECLPIIRKICKETNYLAVIASRRNGDLEYQNYRKFISLTTGFFSSDQRNLYDYLTYLKDAIDNIEDEPQAELIEEDDKVKVMTIHQAKGLEFEAVILFDLYEKFSTDNLKRGTVTLDKEFGILSKIPEGNNYIQEFAVPSAAWFYTLKNNRKLLAENKRLLYVACTRAKNYLAIASYSQIPERNSYYALLCEGMEMQTGIFNDAVITGNLKHLTDISNNTLSEKEVSVSIKVYNGKDEISAPLSVREIPAKKLSKDAAITDYQHGEIISATVFATYKSCPLKYYLTYRLGYGDILEQFSVIQRPYEKNYIITGEDEVIFPEPKLLGNLMHRVLEKDKVDLSDSMLRDLIISELAPDTIPDARLEKYIKTLSQNVYNSKVMSRINSSDLVFNEHSVSVKTEDYILFGRIDKLVIKNESAVIIDYKTGDLNGEDEKIRFYSDQLRFYALIVSKLYPKTEKFELILLPIKSPENFISLTENRANLLSLEDEIKAMIKNIRIENFVKNTAHCKFCKYYQKNNCVHP